MGLALQIMERQSDALEMWPMSSSSMLEASNVCNKWEIWKDNNKEFWEGDSGI